MGINSQLSIDNQRRRKKAFEAQQIESKMESVEESDLLEVRGLGKKSIDQLFSNGIKTVRQLKNKSLDEVKEYVTNPISLVGLEKFFKGLNK